MKLRSRRAARARRAGCAAALSTIALLTSCAGPFAAKDFRTLVPARERLREIPRVRLEDQTQSPPVTVAAAATDDLTKILERPAPGTAFPISLEEVRAAALSNNLDIRVALLAPSIAATSVDEEQARFEATFSANARWSRTDSPTAVATEGSMIQFRNFDVGVDVPLRTGGSVSVTLPIAKTATNNPFSLLNPSYTTDVRFSIAQPLLRGAGNRANTHAIRVAEYRHDISAAQTKLEATRILANADRAYWRLYASQRDLEVAQLQYELAVEQLERARRQVAAQVAAEVEELRAASGLAERLERIIVTQNTVRRRARDLRRIMNRDDLPLAAEVSFVLATQPDPLGLDLDAEALAEHAVANRMEMLELELSLAIDASSIDFQRNQALPLFTMDYSYTVNGLNDSFRNSFGQVADRSFEDWSLGLRAEVPIGNEAARARVHSAILQRLQRLATRDQRDRAIRQEVFDAVDELSQNWQRIIAARQEAILAGRTYEAEQRQFDVGARTSTDVLDAASRLSEAQTREIVALTDYQITQVDIAFATGTLLGYGRVMWDPIDVPEGGRDTRRYDRIQSAETYDEALDPELPAIRQHADEHRPPVGR